jgi:phospholipid/cholesterol/gamma-HCH transport system permease protein
MNHEQIVVRTTHDTTYLNACGAWTLQEEPRLQKALNRISTEQKIVWDLSGIETFDTAGVLLFIDYFERFKEGPGVEVIGYTPEQERMYRLLRAHHVDELAPRRHDLNILAGIGKQAIEAWMQFVAFLAFSGQVTVSFFRYFISPHHLRYAEMFHHIERSGMHALFIIGLTSFLVGLVISYQSAVELAKFGADIFIVDLAGISITRELAPMITAVVVAGRSGSAYTAQIGAMKITEEISAMRTMGFDPYYFLVLPRMLALMITMPLLVFFADIVGIFGSMFAASMELNIGYGQFIDRMQEVLDAKHFWIGMIKAPFFAVIIALIGSFRGFQVTDDTESIGSQTTASVVNAIFFVIAFDALVSVILTRWGI